MTIKHINFDDSPVMRELEKQSIKNGTIELESVADIVEKTSGTKAYQPTGDLYTDLFKLANGLRDRGFVKEADQLEDKIILSKQAESHLYRAIDEDGDDVLEFAHPDGDASVSEAQEEHGMVETLPSAHEKILNVINKTPTGKFAGVIDNIILAAAYALDVELRSLGELDLKKIAAGEDEMEEELSGKGSKKKELIAKLNFFLADKFTKVNDLLKASYQEFNPPAWIFKAEDLLDPGTPSKFKALYGELSGVNPRDLAIWKPKMKRFYGDENFAGDPMGELSRVIRSVGNKEELISWGNEAGQGLGNTYFSGSQPSKEKQEFVRDNPDVVKSPLYRDNANSVWIFQLDPWSGNGVFVPNESKVVGAAKAINDALTSFYNNILGPEKLSAASGKIQEEASKYFNEIKEVAGLFEREPEIDPNVTSLAPILTAINDTTVKLQHLSPKGGAGKKFATLVDARFGETWKPVAFANVDQAVKEVASMVDFLGKNSLSPGDALVSDPRAANLFLSIAKMYRDSEDSVKNPRTLEQFKKYKQLTYKLYKLLQSAQGRPYGEIADEVKKLYPNATTYDKLLQEAQTWAKESAELTGRPVDEYITASAREQLKKLATPPGGSAPTAGAGKPSSAAPGGGTVSQQMGSTTPVRKTKDMEAVARMQFGLSQFAGMINQFGKEKFPSVFNANDANFIWSTGPGKDAGPDRFDGKWGTNTAKALGTAKKYIDSLQRKVGNIITAEPRGYWTGNGHSKDVTQEAIDNLKVLYATMQASGYSVAGMAKESAVYDNIEKGLTEDAVTSLRGNIPVTVTDLSSLRSLYDFLINNGIMPMERGADGVEGLSAKVWAITVSWFEKRSEVIFNAAATPDKKALAAAYRRAVAALRNQLNALFNAFKITSANESNIIPADYLKSQTPGTVGGESSSGSTYPQKGKGHPGQTGGQGAGEGYKMQAPAPNNSAPPITDILDLRTDWWPDMSLQDILVLNQFQKVPAARMALKFFPDMSDKSDQDVQAEAISLLGLRPVGEFNQDYNSWIVQVRGPSGRPTNKLFVDLPKAEQTMAQVKSRDPLNNYQRFLNQLMSNLRKVYDDWMSQADPSSQEASVVQEYHDRWVQAISKQYRDISRQRRTRGQ